VSSASVSIFDRGYGRNSLPGMADPFEGNTLNFNFDLLLTSSSYSSDEVHCKLATPQCIRHFLSKGCGLCHEI
jgi:hypothetical protein